MRTALVVLLLGMVSTSVAAQRTSRARRSERASTTVPVRAELASVLLQSGRYEEAAREYRVLLSKEPGNYDYRLGLAEALAWGNHPREAARELEELAARRRGVPVVDSLLRVVRDAYDPTAAEAAGWLAGEARWAPYRLALARALAREKMPRLAIAQYDTLLTAPGIGPLPDRGTLLREMADAYVAAGDRVTGANRLVAALALTPNDTATRHIIAGMFADAHRYDAAKAQYDTLLLAGPSGPLLLERAQLRLAMGDRAGAESDLWASVAAKPSTSAYILLGDLFRERGDYRGARSMYVAASQGASREMRVPLAAALALLDREERPAMLAPSIGEDPGWRVAEDGATDNLGVTYSSLSLRRTVPVASATRVSLGAEWRQLAEHTAARHLDVAGYGATVGAWQELSYGPLLARLALDGGAVYHPLGSTFGQAHGVVSAWLFAWQAGLELGSEPAYPSLFSAEALLPAAGGRALTERDEALSLGGPLADADVAARIERSSLSDGNRRVTVDISARYPILPDVYAVYSFNRTAFAERSTLYWDPESYSAHGLGLEYAVRRARGLSFSARVLPTYAWTAQDSVPAFAIPGDPTVARGPMMRATAMQLGADAEIGYRARRWELDGAASYGRGRAADYQRGALSVVLRLVP
jgi:tetratricopeptide (TPR) repeat protein